MLDNTGRVGGREPHLSSRPFGLELRPFRPRAYSDPQPLAEYFNHRFCRVGLGGVCWIGNDYTDCTNKIFEK